MRKFKVRNFNTVIYDEEHIQEVDYVYSIDDSVGLLKITLTIPEEADPMEEFVIHLKNIYRGILEYVVYHGKWKYTMHLQKDDILSEYYITKYKMW